MFIYFREKKEKIGEFLKEVFDRKRSELSAINSVGADVCDRLNEFVMQGKMIRGGLVSLGYDLYISNEARSTVEAGAALELLQSALLIHDDIMDRDETRRGRSSVFQQYREIAEKKGLSDPYHLGESMGICAGDVAFFAAFEILSGLGADPLTVQEITRLCSRELSFVGVAQMQDVYWSADQGPALDEGILKLYLYKTGRYTFSLPLMIGAKLAQASPAGIQSLEKLGEALGIIFQIKDDELGLFGSEAETGKPVGSDVKEGKKTLYHSYLWKSANECDRKRLDDIFGNENLSEGELKYVQDLTRDLGIKDEIDAIVKDLVEKSNDLIGGLKSVREEYRHLLKGLLTYSLERTS
jgi:geranylgeranyl diphosphate synthase type I